MLSTGRIGALLGSRNPGQVPTHRDFRDSYFEDPEEWRRQRTEAPRRRPAPRPQQRRNPAGPRPPRRRAGQRRASQHLTFRQGLNVVLLVVVLPCALTFVSEGGLSHIHLSGLASSPAPALTAPAVPSQPASPAAPVRGSFTRRAEGARGRLTPGSSVPQTLITGRRCGYPWEQPATGGADGI